MFTLCINKNSTGMYGFTIVKPDTCYVSGSRDTLERVYEELTQQMQKWEKDTNSYKDMCDSEYQEKFGDANG